MAKKPKLRGTRPRTMSDNNRKTSGFTSLKGQNYKGGYSAATDVQTGYGRDYQGRFDTDARISSKAGRGGQVISRRKRYYDLRLAMGLAGG